MSNAAKPEANDSVKPNESALSEISTGTENDLQDKNDFFSLISSASTGWTAGIPSGGSGTDYFFKIKITTSAEISFDSAWINNKAFKIFIAKESGGISNDPIKYGYGDEIILRVAELNNPHSKSIHSSPPVPYNGDALIGFTIHDKQEYFTIKEITKQSSPNRQ